MAGVKVSGKEHKQREYSNRINRLITQSQAAFAESIGVNRDKVNNWIRGRSEPDVESLIRISKEYGVSTDWILGIAPIDQRSPDVSIQGTVKVTGLSEEAINTLSYIVQEEDSYLLYFLDRLISDVALHKIGLAMEQAISCRNVQKKHGEVDNHAAVYPFLYDILARTDTDLVLSDESTVPSLPKGTMLLNAEDACEYYKGKAIKSFTAFLDEYVSAVSDTEIKVTGKQNTKK